jgi:hypothetical protein
MGLPLASATRYEERLGLRFPLDEPVLGQRRPPRRHRCGAGLGLGSECAHAETEDAHDDFVCARADRVGVPYERDFRRGLGQACVVQRWEEVPIRHRRFAGGQVLGGDMREGPVAREGVYEHSVAAAVREDVQAHGEGWGEHLPLGIELLAGVYYVCIVCCGCVGEGWRGDAPQQLGGVRGRDEEFRARRAVVAGDDEEMRARDGAPC